MKRKLECQFSHSSENRVVRIHPTPNLNGCGMALALDTLSAYDHPQASIEEGVTEISGNVEMILRRSPADREVIQHYQRFTSKVLAMSSTMWSTEVFSLALRVRYIFTQSLPRFLSLSDSAG